MTYDPVFAVALGGTPQLQGQPAATAYPLRYSCKLKFPTLANSIAETKLFDVGTFFISMSRYYGYFLVKFSPAGEGNFEEWIVQLNNTGGDSPGTASNVTTNPFASDFVELAWEYDGVTATCFLDGVAQINLRNPSLVPRAIPVIASSTFSMNFIGTGECKEVRVNGVTAHTKTTGMLKVGDTIRVGSVADADGQLGFTDYLTVMEVATLSRVYNGLGAIVGVAPQIGSTSVAGTDHLTATASTANTHYIDVVTEMYKVNTSLNATALPTSLANLSDTNWWTGTSSSAVTFATRFASNLLSNGDFSANGPTGTGVTTATPDNWKSFSGTIKIYDSVVSDGRFVGIGDPGAYIEQEVALIPGASYVVQFKLLSAVQTGVSGAISGGTRALSVILASPKGTAEVTLGTFTVADGTELQASFVATTTSANLKLVQSGTTAGDEVYVDSVYLARNSAPHFVYKMNIPNTSELKLTVDRGIGQIHRVTLVGYHVRSSDPGYFDIDLRSQDYYTLRIKELQGGGGLISNKPGSNATFAVLSAGSSVNRPLGAVEFEMHDPSGIATAMVSSNQPLRTLTVEVLNMNGEPAKINKLHLWLKLLTTD